MVKIIKPSKIMSFIFAVGAVVLIFGSLTTLSGIFNRDQSGFYALQLFIGIFILLLGVGIVGSAEMYKEKKGPISSISSEPSGTKNKLWLHLFQLTMVVVLFLIVAFFTA